MDDFTKISKEQWKYVTDENLSAKEVVQFLKNDMRVRTFTDNLAAVTSIAEIDKRLAEGLYGIKQGLGEQAQLDNIRRKVRNWMNNKNLPTDREEIFQICFALELDLEQADKLISRLTEQGIHYRNQREMVYAYCLKHGLSYMTGREMLIELQGESVTSGIPGDKHEDVSVKTSSPKTHMMRRVFLQVDAKEDLFTFILNHRAQMGTGHNTAYEYFCKMLATLSGENMAGEDTYSMEYIAEHYLRLNIPVDKRTSGYSTVQKMVKKYWPGARNIKAMKSRLEDVNRKTLLLLYLVTGGVWEKEYEEIDEAYVPFDEFLETHCKKMNKMLMDCGMSRVDPRNIFDCLVLYCLRPEDEVFMSERMEELVLEVFET
ncbi:MAG: hypothetical protein IJ471_04990 [Eubacterium sp.]|nr:hypothetical protein [Eubacterium sp.]